MLKHVEGIKGTLYIIYRHWMVLMLKVLKVPCIQYTYIQWCSCWRCWTYPVHNIHTFNSIHVKGVKRNKNTHNRFDLTHLFLISKVLKVPCTQYIYIQWYTCQRCRKGAKPHTVMKGHFQWLNSLIQSRLSLFQRVQSKEVTIQRNKRNF